MKQTYTLLFIAAIVTASVTTGCQKAVHFPQQSSAPQARVTVSVQGSVVDENDTPVAGALVTAETSTALTDERGKFIISEVALYENSGSVTVEKDGFLLGVVNYSVSEGISDRLQIRLLKRIEDNNENGGNLTQKATN